MLRTGLDRLRQRAQQLFASDTVVDEGQAARIRARQLQAVARLTPFAMLANLLNLSLVAVVFWGPGPRVFLAVWGATLVLIVARLLWTWRLERQRPARGVASKRALRRASVSAAALGLIWGTAPAALLPGAGAAEQVVIATVTTGMICAGGFILASTPWSATAFVLALSSGALAALSLSDFGVALPMAALLLIYAGIVIGGVWSTSRLFDARLLAEAEAERQKEVIGLLLRDFEEHTSDMLWEIDADGRLRNVSPRLASLFGQPVRALTAAPVLAILQRLVADGDAAPLVQLRQHLEAGTAVRELALAVRRGRRVRWWSLSAKPLRDDQGRLTGWRGVAADITKERRSNEQLTWLAHYDALTGLANRHQFRSQLTELMNPGRGQPQPFAVLCLDLDHFKNVNDTLGHAVGDGLLQAVAQRLEAGTRRHDTAARLGGDEFAVILRDAGTVAEVEHMVQRLIETLQAPCELQGAHVNVRASIGVALAPQDGSDIDTLLSHADLALYAAKSAGRGTYRLFMPEMAALTRRRIAIEHGLRTALARGEMSLVYQPQVELADWRLAGFEALLRWHHPELGEVSPGEFVPVAEEAGLMAAIGEWVLVQACREASRWPAQHKVAVNLSPVQALSPDLARTALAAARASGLEPSRLELEITESTFLQGSQATLDALRAVHDAGIRMALDDFGIGYSSLAHLRRFPFDTLKIDRSFVRELQARGDARAIVKTIIGLARTLRMKTVAEGVEDPAHAATLARYGCDAIQGFLFSRPLAGPDVAAFIASWPDRDRPALPEAALTAPMPLTMA